MTEPTNPTGKRMWANSVTADWINDAVLAIEAEAAAQVVDVSVAREIALAVYAGTGGMPDTDAGILLAIAAWMDRIDDITDRSFDLRGMTHRIERGMQTQLRRIAESLADPAP